MQMLSPILSGVFRCREQGQVAKSEYTVWSARENAELFEPTHFVKWVAQCDGRLSAFPTKRKVHFQIVLYVANAAFAETCRSVVRCNRQQLAGVECDERRN